MTWTPHATVATIVKRDNKYLMVEELSHGEKVFNQPAGHIEEHESIFDAAVRETLEETGWRVELESFIGTYIYTAPANGVTYYRFCFAAKALEKSSSELDQDIIAAHWISLDQLKALEAKYLRSPLVLKCIEDSIAKPALPLSCIYEHENSAEL